MSHFPRFRRRKDDIAPGSSTTRGSSSPPGNPSPPGDLLPAATVRRGPRLSPLHVFHRSSGKRPRDIPAPDFETPTTATAPGAMDDLPVSSRQDKEANRLKMPKYLSLSSQEINDKFLDLTLRENGRFYLAGQNPSPDFRWAKVHPPYPPSLDRYINVQPWNNNRVRLQVPQGHVDYVNASPIILKPSSRLRNIGSEGENEGRQGEALLGGVESHRYIAMQGPKKQSTDHVWRMVVEQLENPSVIVMLTETHEARQEKCWPYFPFSSEDRPMEVNEQDEFGDGFRATVRCEGMEETIAGDAIELRKLVIRVLSRPKSTSQPGNAAQDRLEDVDGNLPRNGAVTPDQSLDGEAGLKLNSPMTEIRTAMANVVGISDRISTPDSLEDATKPQIDGQDATEKSFEERVVWHFLYKKWPDFGVPSVEDLESFFTLMRLSREKNTGSRNPRIVHCSAGVGRSGTFIALEHLMRELDAGALEHYDDEELSARASEHDASDPNGVPAQNDMGEDLIFTTVDQLREQRCTMVQAPPQFRFIYEVMRKLWRDKYGDEEVGEPAAKRLEIDPFLEE